MKKAIAAFSVAALLACSANAAIITGLSVESADVGTNSRMSPSDAVDGTGLASYTFGAAHTVTWEHNWWASTNNAQITIDLEGNYSIDAVHIWNYNTDNPGITAGRVMKNVEIYVAPAEDESQLVKLTTSGSGTQDNGSGDFFFPAAPGTNGYTGFGLDLSGVTNSSLLDNVRLVRIQAIGGAGQGLAEVIFDGSAPAIPEPTSLALLGMGGLLVARHRRG